MLGYWSYEITAIRLQPIPRPGEHWKKDDAIEFISTLLHEMLHAYFAASVHRDCWIGGENGMLGHGRPWANVVASIQTRTR